MSFLPTDGAVRDADGTRRIGRFKVLGLVGRGGLGDVYAAHDPELDRRVALKVVAHSEDRAAIARLHREAMTMARLSHPNVARVFDVGDVDGHLFIAMEFVRGVTLSNWLARQPRSWQEIRDVFLAAGQGLAAAHREGIVHRDFKPDNVVIDEDGRARVIDFGLAASPTDALPANTADEDELIETTQPTDPARGGTPAYMAPELQLGRLADARSDQFSFCVALFEALHGRRPFAGRTWQTLSPQMLRGGLVNVPVARTVPEHLHRAAMRGLSPAPERRFPDMDALLSELRRAPSERKGARYLAFGTGLAALIGVGVWLGRPAPDLEPGPPAVEPPSRSPGHTTDAARVEALRGQLELARGLRRELRAAEALQVLTALTNAARKALGAEHELSREAERERVALARELGVPAATP